MTNHIQAVRRLRGETQESLGKQLGLPGSAVSRWERGERMPSLYWALRLAEVLACRVEDLFAAPPSHEFPRKTDARRDISLADLDQEG